ncbi:hypothetical protein [Elioraea sp.]|uniref:hypothetical protein n=1 Tax=Elioraea sp. TaxID=2185103 RepID=UPI0025C68DF1|nr:hypothetical protein [Elioraea sp.]
MSAMLPLSWAETWIAAAYQPPLVAFVLSLALPLLLVLAGRPRVAGLGAAAALVVTLFLVFGARMVTPRMLPERLPWLVLGAAALGLAGDLVGLRGRLAGAVAAIGAVAAGWFMLGAPRVVPDLARVLAESLPVLAAFAIPAWRLVPVRAGPVAPALTTAAALVLAAGLWFAGSAAVFVGLAMLVVAAGAGLLIVTWMRVGAGAGLAGTLALAAGLGGVAVAAGLAMRAPASWAAAAAPLMALAAGFRAAAAMGLAPGGIAGGMLGTLAAGLPLAGLAFLLAGAR